MAIEEKILLQVEQAQAATSIKELRDSVKSLRQTVSEATIGSEEYRVASEGLQAAQNALANATKLGTKETKLAGDSYNALSRTMAELKQQYHSVTDEVKRKELAKEINAINERLKAMDSDVGVFARNVGNYADGVAKGFSAMGGAAGSMINPIKGVTTGFQALSKTPVIAIIGLLINIFAKAYGAMKKSEQGAGALTKMMSGLSFVADLMTKALQKVAEGLVWVADKFMDLWNKIRGVNDETTKRMELSQAEIDLDKKKRDALVKNSEDELKISKLRSEAADKANNSARERIKLLEQTSALELGISQRNKEIAEEELRIIKEKNALMPSSAEELQAQAEAQARVNEAQKAYYDKQRKINAQLSEAKNAARREDEEREKADYERRISEIENDPAVQLERARQEAIFDIRHQVLENEHAMFDELKAMDAEHGEDMKRLADAAVKYEEQTEASRKKIADREKKWQKDKYSYIGSLMSSAAKLAGENSAIGKALAVANTTISTYQSAQQAYASQFLPVPDITSPARGALAAAAAVASGLANIKAILAVKTDGKSTSMPAVGATMMTAAPAVIQQVPVMRSLTGVSEEERLNAIMNNTGQTASGVNQPVKAYVVQSELEGEQLYADTRNQESSF